MGTGQPAWFCSTGRITVRRFWWLPKFGFLVGTLEARSSFQQLSGNSVRCGEENQMAAAPAVLPGLCAWKHLRTLSKGAHAHPQARPARRGDGPRRKHTLTLAPTILVCRNLKLTIRSTYTMKNPFIESKSNWRSKDGWPERKYLKNKIYGDGTAVAVACSGVSWDASTREGSPVTALPPWGSAWSCRCILAV